MYKSNVKRNKKQREKVYRSLRRILKNPTREVVKKEFDKFRKNDSCKRIEIAEVVMLFSDGSGFCGVLWRLHRINNIASLLSELWSKKPARMYDNLWWWKPGNNKVRIKVLDSIINEMH